MFKKFLESVSMKGTYQFMKRKAVTKMFFDSYFLDVNPENKLIVLTLNKARNTSAKFTLEDVNVIEDGIIPITDAETIIDVLSTKGLGDDLEIESKDTIMTINDGKTAIEIEQRESKDTEELKNTNIVKQLEDWDNLHEHNDDGILVISAKKHPKLENDLPYKMQLKIKKSELIPLIGTTLKLTKDNKTALVFDGKFRAHSVQANSRIRLKNTDIECKINGEPFEFEYECYSLQSILPNLFDDIEINLKTAKAKDDDVMKSYLNIYIVSKDPKLKMETIIAFSSIGKEIKSP